MTDVEVAESKETFLGKVNQDHDERVSARADFLEEEIRRLRQAYYAGNPEVPDEAFDALEEELLDLRPESLVLFEETGPEPDPSRKVVHPSRMGSLDKIKDTEKLRVWWEKCAQEAGLGDSLRLTITPKIDGVALRLQYEDGKLVMAVTRGDGFEGEDVTANALMIDEIPKTVDVEGSLEVRGEVYMTKARSDELGMSNPRNATSGALSLDNPVEVGRRGLKFFAYQAFGLDVASEVEMREKVLRLGFPVLEMGVAEMGRIEDLESILADWRSRREDGSLPYAMDGAVVSLDDIAAQEELGWTGKYPNGKRAFKFPPVRRSTPVLGIDCQVGRSGRLTPMARLEPVFVDGSMVSNATLHNWRHVVRIGVSVGDVIGVEKGGDIIPQVACVECRPSDPDATIFKTTFPEPTECPSCGSTLELDERGVFHWCRSNACPEQLKGRILNWVRVTDMKGVGKSTVEALTTSGVVATFADLYRLGIKHAATAAGGEVSGQNVLDAIGSKQTLKLSTFIRALGVPGFGNTASRNVAREFGTLAAVRAATVAEIGAVPKVGARVTKDFVGFLRDGAAIVDDLLTVVDVEDEIATGPLAGKAFAITGKTSRPKKHWQADIEAAGGEFRSSVGKDVNFLVMSDPDSTSAKAEKARKYGTKCIGEEELTAMLEG